MKGTLTNLNVNPCKMCMPMGAVTALYGIRRCMSILHGSQGCSTYIRRHMATHYNEPVDIASSSLTEEGTVYGGEKNLNQGLLNLIKVYRPEVIGVATTCLAETIGEDIRRIIHDFHEKYPEYHDITIIPVSSPGYGGTQYEGYSEAICQIVKTVPMVTTPNERINVITGQLSPADTRYLKELLEEFGIDAILLPDLSGNLDGIYQEQYNRLPETGTKLEDICQMAGAKATIEIAAFLSETRSAGGYLQDTYGIPVYRCPLPISLRDNDELLAILHKVSGRPVSERIVLERGRFLDAMIDGHKYNGEAKAVIYGEPDFVYSTVRLCLENGIMPLVTATGTKCVKLKELLHKEIEALANRYFIDRFEILDEIDFQSIEQYAKELQANLLIGNSDGRRIAEKLGIKLVRRGFPIHDRVGGQRLRSIGYEGALTFLDEISNSVLEVKEESFRDYLYHKYFKDEKQGEVEKDEKDEEKKDDMKKDDMKKDESSILASFGSSGAEKTIEEKTATHPCYNCKAHQYSRIHLPVAPHCNISCNYCVRKYDCPNESRPGVTTGILSPEEALQRFLTAREKLPNLTVVGIAGPGDALANFEETRRTLQLIKAKNSDITFCLSTNGLMLPKYAQELAALGVSHVTVTMNAVDPAIGARIYRNIDYLGVRYHGEAAAAILMTNQFTGIQMLTAYGIICKVNIVMIKGVNDRHIPEVVKKVKDLGGTVTNIMPMIPVEGAVFEDIETVTEQELMDMRKSCSTIMEQMYHCRQCRADAVGLLGEDRSGEFTARSEKKLRVAVATKSGMMVDQHFGHVKEFYVYEYGNGNTVFKEKRSVSRYCSGALECDTREENMETILRAISDCNAVIAMRIGDAPKQTLKQRGIKVFTTVDKIETSVKKAVEELL